MQVNPTITADVGKLPIELSYPEGHSLGVTKKSLKIEAVFLHKKPLSFTTFIDFYDDDGAKFDIPISGTTDNSLFTVMSFLQTNEDEVKISPYTIGQPINLV